ncbi:MAG: galactokinase [Candidatus Thermofonsia Clade 1 bacterium]|uniref:Galactokinase n=1 Tax=Candidatus Thermofonsia Clade 1 bacterium TaxID=2364210 RepID=A0A2M8PG09_9CHLR|nr:MAG: galactokinase [Candidatus Thermofonsia Clade 1 bacterium]RMF50502.1 MAG: galactokinase [Chloroflexota bacterium]
MHSDRKSVSMSETDAIVFLMGTAGNSQWREPIKAACAAEGISAFDPVVPNWDEAASRREAEALQRAQVVLMAITAETASLGALAESGWTALSALKRHQALGLYVDPNYVASAEPQAEAQQANMRATALLEDASQRARKLVIQHAARLVAQFPELNIYLAKDLADLQAWAVRTAKARLSPSIRQVAQPQQAALAAYRERHQAPPLCLAYAPGRVNLIGEHTDYNDGFVLPAAIDKAIYIAANLREDDLIVLHSLDFDSEVTFPLARLHDDSLPAWTRYIRGAIALSSSIALLHGQNPNRLRGMNLTIAGDVPLGAGFSSSAAIEVAMFEALSALLGLSLTQTQKALLGQQVEHHFIGIRSGIMDQLIAAIGKADHALLIDCRSLEATPVPLPKGVTIVTFDTGVRRELVNSEYGLRREQCEQAARLMGVPSLRDATPELLAAKRAEMPEIVARRAQHVLDENARTLAAVEALRQGDLTKVGALLNASHASLSQLYEVSIPELDLMAELARQQAGVYGARMMGGGFGGAVIALVADEAVPQVIERVSAAYTAQTGRPCTPYTAKAGMGSGVIYLGGAG